ncbi:BrxA/BrxB family bacilliredoxin [Staphylococcus epidermidis]|uniref:BrxA/BrxB family bacilliredoxin n=1 Tax=Staphylococcus epidermidis TaxID=1282 RepID=UPI0037D9E247
MNSTSPSPPPLPPPPPLPLPQQNQLKPHHKLTLFPAQHKQPTQTITHYIQQLPSTPSYPLFKPQHLLHFIPPQHIQAPHINHIPIHLKHAFDHNSQ